MTETDLCPICKNPKRSSSFGSLTQWIVACNCDLRDADLPDEDEVSITICRDCGKRLGEGRAGSFTQFIFRSDVCRCKVPRVLKNALDAAPIIEESDYTTEDSDEIALDLGNDSFPSERYKPLSQLGTGGGGSVYLARDIMLNKRVAVKMLHMLEQKLLVAFQDEARATSKLNHPNIVGLIDFGLTKNEIPYMVLDYFQGRPLDDLIEKEGSLDWPLAQQIFDQVCGALEYAHNNGVFHRDIKPSNILLSMQENGKVDVKIIDFGIAKMEGSGAAEFGKQATTVVGAPLYMSPDSGLGVQYDSRSEVYSLGCVMFEALTGSPPFQGETAIQTLSLHAHQAPPPMVEVQPDKDIPEEIEDLVLKALSKKPEDRFQNMEEMGQAIRSIDLESLQQIHQVDEKKSPLVVALKRIMIVGLLALTVWEVAQITFLAPPPPLSDAELKKKKEAAKTAAEFRKNKKEIDELKTDEILNTLNLTGGKWKKTKTMLEGHEIVDEDFKSIPDCKGLTFLKITVESRITGEGFKYIAGAPFTNILMMSNSFDDKGAEQLCKLSKLKKVAIHYDSNLTAKGVRTIVNGLPNLESLLMRFMMLKPGMVDAATSGKKLRLIDFGHSQNLTVDDMRHLRKVEKLETLIITNTGLGDDAIEEITKIPITHLDIGENRITDAGLMMIAERLPGIKSVKISVGDGITSIGAKRFKKKMPGCLLEVTDGLNPLQLLDMK